MHLSPRQIFYWLESSTGINVRYYIPSGLYSVIGDAWQLLSGLLLSILFARLSSQEVFGQFQLISSFIALLAVVSLRGFDTVILRDVARGFVGVYSRVAHLRYRWSMLAIPLAIIIGVCSIFLNRVAVGWAFIISSFFLPTYYVSQQGWQQYWRGRAAFAYVARAIAIRSFVTFLFVGVVLFLDPENVVTIFMAYLVSQIAINQWLHSRVLQISRSDSVSADWRSYGYLLTKTGIVKLLGTHADKLLVGILFSPAALALYAIAIIFPSNVLLLQKSLLQTVAPQMGQRTYITFYELTISLLLGVPFFLVTCVGLYFLIPLLYGEAYADAVFLGLIASASVIFQPLTSLLLHFIQVASKKQALVFVNTFCPLLKVLLLVIFGLVWGVSGIAVVFSLMSLIWCGAILFNLSIDFRRRIVY